MTDLTLALILKAETAAARVALQEMTTAIKGLTPASQAASTEAARIGPALASAGSQGKAAMAGLKSEMAAVGVATRTAAGQVAGSMHLAAGSVGNLTAQFNDIGIMMAAGQAPLQMAIQQGSQIIQVIGPLGAAGAVKALKAAFTGLFTPVSLITLGVIAGGAALVQWAVRAVRAGKDTRSLTDRVKTLGDATKAYENAAHAAGVSV